MKILSIVGARPEFVQGAPVSRALREHNQEILVHTGQHYDYQMSQAFFDELGIPAPDYNLGVGSGSHGWQTAEILARLEHVLIKEQPDLVIVRGDTNSTLSGVLAASKLHIPTAHVEAGERSFDRRMPEEINRLVADSIADLHFCVSQSAVRHLAAEGITGSVHWVGDVMLDALLQNRPIARRRSVILSRLDLRPGAYSLVTVHRAGNTDDPVRLSEIVQALNDVQETVVFPMHPRTRNALARLDAQLAAHIRPIEPVSYFDMMMLEENARLIATDSGGVQREAYFLRIPCLTLRDETEWVETVEVGWNRLVGADAERILEAWYGFAPPTEHPDVFGDGTAAVRIARVLRDGAVSFGLPCPKHAIRSKSAESPASSGTEEQS
ncbi:MAG: UDP-N-acetylglucosamine 2-epimerase (non-hydrolyzing) [Chloroflexi bacterium]|nr:UDP-N-acetylglucosamine 2-epimerase (non-hydrolyzing) [Chloroflexota bacterium]